MGQAVSRQEKFWEACGYGRTAEVRRFLKEGSVDVNWVSYTHDCCPIHVASQGKPEIVKMLLDEGSKVNVKDNRGNLPLHHAAMKGHANIIKTLMEAGSEINVQDKNGWSPLHCAAYWCHPEATDVLIDQGSDISLLNKDERSALHETCRSPEKDESKLGTIANLLIKNGTDINAKSSDEGEADFTPLMFAAYHGHPAVAMALIDANCDIHAVGTNGWTALHWATDRDHKELVYLLLEAGADPTIKGERGELASERTKDKELKSVLRNAEKMFKELSILDEADKAIKKKSTASKVSATAAPLAAGATSSARMAPKADISGTMVSPTESDKVLLSVSSVSSKSAPLVEEEQTGVSDDDEYDDCRTGSDCLKTDGDTTETDEALKECDITEYPRDDADCDSEKLEDFEKYNKRNTSDLNSKEYVDEEDLLRDEDKLLCDVEDQNIQLYEPEIVY